MKINLSITVYKLISARLTLILLASSFILHPSSFAQVSYVNLSTPSTNTVTTKGVISIPGQFTNTYTAKDTNNNIIGDPLSTAFGKLNADIFFLWNWDQTNDFGTGGGGAGTDTNRILINFGVGHDLTITNTFTLTSSNITGYTLTGITITGSSNSCVNGTYVYDSLLLALTNQCGYVFSAVDQAGWAYVNGVLTNVNNMTTVIAATVSGSADTNKNGHYTFADYSPPTIELTNVSASCGTAKFILKINVNNDMDMYDCSPGHNPYSLNGLTDTSYFTLVNHGPYTMVTGNVAFGQEGAPFPTVVFSFASMPPEGYVPSLNNNFTNANPPVIFQWVILQPNGTQQSNGTYTNYTFNTVNTGGPLNPPAITNYVSFCPFSLGSTLSGSLGAGACTTYVFSSTTNNACGCPAVGPRTF